MWSGWEIDISANDNETRSCMARSMDKNWYSRSESRKTRMEKREAQTRQCSTTERNLFHWSRWQRIQGNPWKCQVKIGKTHDTSHVVQENGSFQHHESRWIACEKIPKTIYVCIVESHESIRQRVESSQPKNHEDHIAGKGFTSMSQNNLVNKFIRVSLRFHFCTWRSYSTQRIYFDVSLQFGTQVHSDARSDANSRCKSSSG